MRTKVAALVVGLLIGGVALIGIFHPFSGDKATAVTAPAAVQQALTVNPSDLLPESAKCSSGDELNKAAAYEGPFKWSDSVSTAFASSDKKEMLTELLKENCTNPVLLDMNVQALSAVTIDGWKVGDHNPWMGEFLSKAEKSGLRTAFLTKKQGQGETIFVTADMQQTASYVNTLILRFTNEGVVSKPSLANWHRPGGGLVAGELVRTVLNSKQEGLPALRLELTEKDQGCVLAVGFNTGDKRWETLPCGPAPAPSTGPSQGPKTPPPTHAPTPRPTPGHKTPSPSPTPTPKTCPPSMPHGVWPICKDDPSKQPGPGKAPNGAGKNADPGPGVPNPSPTFPSAPHTNPAPPEPVKSSRPDPVQPPATGAPAPSNPGTSAGPGTCIAAPGRPCM